MWPCSLTVFHWFDLICRSILAILVFTLYNFGVLFPTFCIICPTGKFYALYPWILIWRRNNALMPVIGPENSLVGSKEYDRNEPEYEIDSAILYTWRTHRTFLQISKYRQCVLWSVPVDDGQQPSHADGFPGDWQLLSLFQNSTFMPLTCIWEWWWWRPGWICLHQWHTLHIHHWLELEGKENFSSSIDVWWDFLWRSHCLPPLISNRKNKCASLPGEIHVFIKAAASFGPGSPTAAHTFLGWWWTPTALTIATHHLHHWDRLLRILFRCSPPPLTTLWPWPFCTFPPHAAAFLVPPTSVLQPTPPHKELREANLVGGGVRGLLPSCIPLLK